MYMVVMLEIHLQEDHVAMVVMLEIHRRQMRHMVPPVILTSHRHRQVVMVAMPNL